MENQLIKTEEKENLNLIIPKLIGKSIEFSKAMKQKMKSNLIFNEFDHKASKDFNYYLNESNKRYIGLKNGGQLDKYLKESQIKNRKKAKKILSDNFYTSLNLDKDREAMKINHNGPLLTEMNEIIKKIKEESDNSIDTNSIKEEINKKLYKKKLRESILLQQSQNLINEIPFYTPEKGNHATELSKKIYIYFIYIS